MDAIVAGLLFGIWGLVSGVVVSRLEHGLALRRGLEADRCGDCGQAIRWPGRLRQRASASRCAKCRHRVTRQWVQTVVAAAFLGVVGGLAGVLLGLSVEAAAGVLYSALLVLVALVDLRWQIIPNGVVVAGVAAGLVLGPFVWRGQWWQPVAGGLLSYLCFLVAALVGRRWFGEGAIGGGDVKLAGLVGVLVGLSGMLPAIILGVVGAGLYSLGMLILARRSLRDGFAYGPWLALGGWVVLAWRLVTG